MPRLAPYYKAVVSGVGNLVSAGTAIASLLALAPQGDHGVAVCVSTLLGALAVANTLHVYLQRNEPLITDLDSAIGDLPAVAVKVREAFGHGGGDADAGSGG